MKILVIDDEFEVRETIREMLAEIALDVLLVADAISALLALKDYSDIHTVITDYRLPGLGGEDWIDIIRHYHPEKNLVVITGYEVAKEKVADRVKVLMKPFDKYQLLEAIGM
jgi:DNA-binding NtrC family response regulator